MAHAATNQTYNGLPQSIDHAFSPIAAAAAATAATHNYLRCRTIQQLNQLLESIAVFSSESHATGTAATTAAIGTSTITTTTITAG
jgi:hypothetical protein